MPQDVSVPVTTPEKEFDLFGTGQGAGATPANPFSPATSARYSSYSVWTCYDSCSATGQPTMSVGMDVGLQSMLLEMRGQ